MLLVDHVKERKERNTLLYSVFYSVDLFIYFFSKPSNFEQFNPSISHSISLTYAVIRRTVLVHVFWVCFLGSIIVCMWSQSVCSLFWVGQCLLLGPPLFVSGCSDCRLYFRLSRNVLLTILVLTD